MTSIQGLETHVQNWQVQQSFWTNPSGMCSLPTTYFPGNLDVQLKNKPGLGSYLPSEIKRASEVQQSILWNHSRCDHKTKNTKQQYNKITEVKYVPVYS